MMNCLTVTELVRGGTGIWTQGEQIRIPCSLSHHPCKAGGSPSVVPDQQP